MKKTILLFLLVSGGALAQTNSNPGPFWTNGVTVVTNIPWVGTQVPLGSNQLVGLQFAVQKWNNHFNLTGTNRYNIKDAVANAAWHVSGQWYEEWKATQESKDDVRKIRTALIDATDQQLQQIKSLLGIGTP